MRVLIEVLHVLTGLVAAYAIGWASAWSYPLATTDIWTVTYAGMCAVILMGIGPIRRAFAKDKAWLARTEPIAHG